MMGQKNDNYWLVEEVSWWCLARLSSCQHDLLGWLMISTLGNKHHVSGSNQFVKECCLRMPSLWFSNLFIFLQTTVFQTA